MPLFRFIFPILLSLLAISCARSREEGQIQRAVGPAEATSVASSATRSRLLVGTASNRFYSFDPRTGSMLAYPLPPTDTVEPVYAVRDLGNDEFLVARRNHGIERVKYDLRGDSAIIASHSFIPMPSGSLPDKGIHYSTYDILRIESLIFLGTSNGLLTLCPEDQWQTRYVLPLKPMRDNVYQFAVRKLRLIKDSVEAFTERGVYAVALSDIDNPAAKPRLITRECEASSPNLSVTTDSAVYIVDSGRLYQTASVLPEAEKVRLIDPNGYILSDRGGIWHGKQFLGDLKDASSVKAISFDTLSCLLYQVRPDGIYQCSVSKGILPHGRSSRLFSPNPEGDSYVSLLATPSGLFAGSRKSLRKLDKEGNTDVEYRFPELEKEYQNPYVTSLTLNPTGQIIAGTLNHGNWEVPARGNLMLVYDRPMDVKSGLPGDPLPERPWLTMESLLSRWPVMLCIIVVAVLLIVGALIVVRRHRVALTSRSTELAKIIRRYPNLNLVPIAENLEAFVAEPLDKKKRSKALNSLSRLEILVEKNLDNLKRLLSSLPAEKKNEDEGSMQTILADFRQKAEIIMREKLAIPQDAPLTARLEALAEVTKLLPDLESAIEKWAEFPVEEETLKKKWWDYLALDSHAIWWRYPLLKDSPQKKEKSDKNDKKQTDDITKSDKKKTKDKDAEFYDWEGRYLFLSVVFCNNYEMAVGTKKISDERKKGLLAQTYNDKMGSLYKYLADMMTKEYVFAERPPLIPATTGDILWHLFVRKANESFGNNGGGTLPQWTKQAIHYRLREEPDKNVKGANTRGRPKKTAK